MVKPLMVAGREPSVTFDPTGQSLLVNEVFYSLQGEGHRTGRPTVFIRLAKCNLACAFCDTEFEAYTVDTVAEVLAKVKEAIAQAPSNAPVNVLVDITGGEPMLQRFGPLVDALHIAGFQDVGMETSGSVWNDDAWKLDWLTCSPKIPLDKVPAQLKELVDEWKWIVNQTFRSYYSTIPELVYAPGAWNFLQPESNKAEWIDYAKQLCMDHPERYRLSLQTHKIARMP